MIHLAGIERTFLVGDEAVHALSSVNFTVRQGEYVAIMDMWPSWALRDQANRPCSILLGF